MSRRHRPFRLAIYGIILLAGLAWISFSAVPAEATTSGRIPAPKEGFTAPIIELASLDNTLVRLSDLHGKVVLVNLWASWCPPCDAEMPTIQKVYRDYKDQGFEVLAVNATNQDSPQAAAEYARSHALSFTILLDSDGGVSRKYQLRALPTSFFVDRQGTIRKVIVGGPIPEAALRYQVESLLAEAQ